MNPKARACSLSDLYQITTILENKQMGRSIGFLESSFSYLITPLVKMCQALGEIKDTIRAKAFYFNITTYKCPHILCVFTLPDGQW